MKRRTRRSKLRGVRRLRRTLRRGGVDCRGINKAGLQSRMAKHEEIIKDMMAVYDENPTSVFTQEVDNLMQEHCDEFLEELRIAARDLYPLDKKNPLYKPENEKLLHFRIALIRRFKTKENLSTE